MTTDDREAAWAAVHDATPAGWQVQPRVLAFMAVCLLLAGCQFAQPVSLPASFIADREAKGLTFEVAERPFGPVAEADVVAALRARVDVPMFRSRGVPLFVLFNCTRPVECAFPTGPQSRTRTAWLVVYPDWVGADGDAGWAIVDAPTGLAAGYFHHDPREP